MPGISLRSHLQPRSPGAGALLRFIAEFERTEEAAVLPRLWEDGADEEKDEPLPWTFPCAVMLAAALEKMTPAAPRFGGEG
jgi:hypothetical protein